MSSTPSAPPAFWQVDVTLSKAALDPLEAALEGMSVALMSTEVDEAKGLWRLQALCEDKPDMAVLSAALSLAAAATRTEEAKASVTRLEGRDWLRENLVAFPPIQVGRFFVHGSHHADPHPVGCWPLLVDAATAFGSGDHNSTRGCLMAMDALTRKRRFANVLDMGCGSGILSLAAARAWACPVLGVDIDQESVRVSRLNARINGLSSHIRAIPGNGAKGREVLERGPYDLILANILARPLRSLAKPLASLLASGGIVVLAGLLDRQERMVLDAYATQGLRLIRRIHLEPWSTLVLG
ncbi:MAG: 50S ribosomal protein L11 methyltransferase [Rhodospirillum sp.]|nr:50S ribosomal protein L11 methyltransferase [Rhodospirillum sp.]MCF8489376.1 50S ribosomal protein L11 methyltransferase [Rhodospirillum sp.]MCF8501724.1 50S ribosomal protein L11 methyltransferase [Rhodospirillum sp.]